MITMRGQVTSMVSEKRLILTLINDVISTVIFDTALNMAQELTVSKYVRVQKDVVMANKKIFFQRIMNMLRKFLYILSE